MEIPPKIEAKIRTDAECDMTTAQMAGLLASWNNPAYLAASFIFPLAALFAKNFGVEKARDLLLASVNEAIDGINQWPKEAP